MTKENDTLKTAAKIVAGAAVAGGIGYLVYRNFFTENKGHKKEKAEFAKPAAPPAKAKNKGDESEATSLKNKGNMEFKAGRYQDAIRLYSDAIKACVAGSQGEAEASACYQNRAAAQEKLERWEEVISDSTLALAKNSRYVKAYLRRAKAYERCMKYKESLEDYTAACILEQFSNYSTMESADRVLKSLSEERAGMVMKERGNASIPLSATFVESYLASFCEDPVLNALRPIGASNGGGDHYPTSSKFEELLEILGAKQYEEVVDACDTVIKMEEEKELEARLVRATFALIQGNSKNAASDFEELFRLLDNQEKDQRTKKIRANALVKRGSFHMQQGRKDQCLADFDEAERVDPENADIYHHRGQLLILMNEIDKAKADFEKCIKLRRDFAVARVQACYANYRYAVMSDSMLNTNNSIVEFERIMDEFRDCAEGYALLGQVYVERRNYEDAETMFDKALNLAPNNANIYVHKGLLALQREEDYNKAKSCIQDALKVDPFSEFAFETLGTIEVQRGRIKEAVDAFDDALKLARTEIELVHLFSLREAAMAQVTVARNLGVELPGLDNSH